LSQEEINPSIQLPHPSDVAGHITWLGLKRDAASAFKLLCDRNCRPKALAYLVDRWATETRELKLAKRTFHLWPLDNRSVALGGLSKRNLARFRGQLKRHARALEKIAATVCKLQATPLFKRMYQEGELRPEAHLLALSANMKDYAENVVPKIVKACGGIGPRQQRDRNQLLLRLAHYVKECTGRAHYQQLSDVLSHFEPMSVATLKNIVSRQGLALKK